MHGDIKRDDTDIAEFTVYHGIGLPQKYRSYRVMTMPCSWHHTIMTAHYNGKIVIVQQMFTIIVFA